MKILRFCCIQVKRLSAHLLTHLRRGKERIFATQGRDAVLRTWKHCWVRGKGGPRKVMVAGMAGLFRRGEQWEWQLALPGDGDSVHRHLGWNMDKTVPSTDCSVWSSLE